MGVCSSQQKKDIKLDQSERCQTEPQNNKINEYQARISTSRKSADTKQSEQFGLKKKAYNKQESLKICISVNKTSMDKFYIKKNVKFLDGVNFRESMSVVQHIVTGKMRIAETFQKSQMVTGFVNKIISLQLIHRNLLDIYAIFENDQTYTIITDYCNGGSLLQLIHRKEESKLNDQSIQQFCKQIYELMNYLHKNGLYHGSLSLKSFEKYNNGKNLTIKLTDYFALFIKQEININNVQFLSPECCNEKQSYTQARDLWAIGIITMILNFQVMPFIGTSVQEIQDNIIQCCKKDNYIQKELDKQYGNYDVKQLILLLCQTQPSKRSNLIQILDTKQMKADSLNQQMNKYIANQYLGQFFHQQQISKSNFLQNCFLLMLIKQFDQTYPQHQEIFNGLDIDRNGRLSKQELITIYKKNYQSRYKPEEIEQIVNEIFQAADFDQNGDLEFSEFLIAMADKKLLITDQNLKIIFTQINNGDPIGFKELQPIFKTRSIELQDSLTQFPNQQITNEQFKQIMYELIEIE